MYTQNKLLLKKNSKKRNFEAILASIYIFFLLFFSYYAGLFGALQAVVWASSIPALLFILLPKINFNQNITIPKPFLLYGSLLLFALIGLPQIIDGDYFWKYFRVFASNFILMCIVFYSVKDMDDVLTLCKGMLFTCFCVALASYFYHINPDEDTSSDTYRLSGIVGNANGLANFAKLGIYFSLLLLEMYGKKARLILIPVILFLGYTVILTASRAAFLTTLLAVGGYIIIKYFSGARLIILLILFFLFGTLAFSLLEDQLKGFFLYQRLTRDQGVKGLEEEKRTELFQRAIDVFFEHPLFGVGLSQFRFYNEDRLIAHTDIVSIFAELGIFAGLAYVGMYGTILQRLMKMKKTFDGLLKNKFSSLLILFFVCEIMAGFGNTNWYNQMTLIFFSILVAATSKKVVTNTHYQTVH